MNAGRTVLDLARVEASLLARRVLVLAGLLAGGAMVWFLIRSPEPLWWSADWEIGGGQLILGMTVLVAAQLAAGRSRRDGLGDLYASFPATAGTRTLGYLTGLAGAVPASLLLIGVAAVVVQVRGAIGTPNVTVLADGPLLVIAAGAAGIAIGTRFAHPMAGVLGALVLLLSSETTSHLTSGAAIWLAPWETGQDDLGGLPGPLAGYPPARAHALELAGLAVLAGIVALAVTAGRARLRSGLVAAGVVAVAAICFAGAVQLRPIPAAALSHLVSETADPAQAQRCETVSQVRYCLYPGFGSMRPSLAAPVDAVLAHLPARPAQPLTIRQGVVLLPDTTLTHGYPDREVSQWTAQTFRSQVTDGAAASTIYLQVGTWPAGGGQLADARFDLALATAEWAVRLPGTVGTASSINGGPACVPVDQAREAVAIWLAIVSLHLPASELQAGLGRGIQGTDVRGGFVRVWNSPGNGYVTPPGGGPQNTAAGYLLADAMVNLPEQKVSHVLAGEWGSWVNWHTTDAQLAAALGLPMPSVDRVTLPSGKTITIEPPPGSGPQSPLCTA